MSDPYSFNPNVGADALGMPGWGTTNPRQTPAWLQALIDGGKSLWTGVPAAATQIGNALVGAPVPQPTPSPAPVAGGPNPTLTPATPPKVVQRGAMTGGAQTFSVPMGQPPGYWGQVNAAEGTTQNPRSSASGPYQFTDPTFSDFLKATHPDVHQQFAALPPEAQRAFKNQWMQGPGVEEAKNWILGRNTEGLAKANVPVNDSTLYGAHFLGPDGMSKIWNADPNTPVAQLLSPKAIMSNPEVLSGKTAGQVKEWLTQKMSVIPQAPTLGAPPQMAAPKPYDFSQYKALLDKASPNAGTHLASILGGMAEGAGSVNASEPGSFAKALALAGAGASKGFSQSSRDFQTDAANKAHAEMGMMTMQHGVEKDQADVAYTNAKNAYDTVVKNQQTQFEQQYRNREALMPKVSADANGITIQQFNPQTNKMDIQFHPTKPVVEQLEKMKGVLEGMNTPGPVAGAMRAKMVIDNYANQPMVAKGLLTQLAMNETLEAGAGSQVFGQSAYETAVKAATKELQLENPTMTVKPELYQKALMDKVASRLLQIAGSDERWLTRAVPHSPAAATMAGPRGGE